LAARGVVIIKTGRQVSGRAPGGYSAQFLVCRII